MAQTDSPDTKPNLAALVRQLADTHHGGAVFPMAERTGLSPAVLNQWRHGMVKRPRIDTLLRLAAAYALDPALVLEAAYGQTYKAILGDFLRLTKTARRPHRNHIAILCLSLGLGLWAGGLLDLEPAWATLGLSTLVAVAGWPRRRIMSSRRLYLAIHVIPRTIGGPALAYA